MDTMNDAMVSRRGFVKGSALAGLGVAVAGGGAFSLFGCSSQGEQQTGASEPTESAEQVFWGHCSVNCEGRCSLQLHVKDDEVVWVESDNTGDDEYGNHQIRACVVARSGDGSTIPIA